MRFEGFISPARQIETMRSECLLCGTVQDLDDYRFCNSCHPPTCINCHVSAVHYGDEHNTYKCSHGCEFTVTEYMKHRLYTILLNGSWREKLAVAGDLVEYVIPNPETITVHECPPESIPDGSILGTHFTDDKNNILKHGVSEEELEPPAERLEGTIRDGAAYAWPYTVEFAEAALSWMNTPVVFEIPRDEVYVSSYRFLRNCSNETKYGIPPAKYKSELTFTPTQLLESCMARNQPAAPETLFLSNT